MNNTSGPYSLFIDTGGTFTDTIAADSNGIIINRVKVLSSSALRGTCKRMDTSTIDVQLYENFDLADHCFEGYRLRFTGLSDQSFNITNSKKNRLTVGAPLPTDLPEKTLTSVEIQSPEEAPVLAARLITNTHLRDTLPSLQMRLSTTKGANALLERRGAPPFF